MLQSISPYALLQASKPKSPSTMTTAYDLYSAVQSSTAETAVMQPVSTPASEEPQQPAPPPYITPPAPPRKTHYIADIKSRHNAANRFARQTPMT